MQNNLYWPYVLNLAGSFSKAKWDEIQTQGLVRCEMNTKEKDINSKSGTGGLRGIRCEWKY